MRRALAVVAVLLLAGCTSPPPGDGPPPASLGFVAARLDTTGDGLYDTVNITLLAAPGAIAADRLAFEVDGEALDTLGVLGREAWRPGAGARMPCDPGVHEFVVRVDGAVKKVVVLECGVPAPRLPPFFQGRVVDGDADGRNDAIELTLIGGGPVTPDTLEARLNDLRVRLYENPFKSQVARAALGNGSRVYTPCHPDHPGLNLTWQSRALPRLQLAGCAAFVPGVDAPLSVGGLDLDGDRVQDGWNFTLGATIDGPFDLEEVRASWASDTSALNASIALDPPPRTWAGGGQLVATCPGEGAFPFTLYVRGVIAFRSVTVCEAPPGKPLLELSFDEDGGRLLATLSLSRLGALDAGNVTTPGGSPIGEGVWPVGETRSLACPGGTLELFVGERLAFRGSAPC